MAGGNRKGNLSERLAVAVGNWAGGSSAFALACLIVLAWAVTGPLFDFSNTWQLVINTGTTIVTFLMVFLIQRSQNKDTRAIELKLDEIVASLEGASNRLIAVENLSEADLEKLRVRYQRLAEVARGMGDQTRVVSLEETAQEAEAEKRERRGTAGARTKGERGGDGGR